MALSGAPPGPGSVPGSPADWAAVAADAWSRRAEAAAALRELERDQDAHLAHLVRELELLCPRPSELGLCDEAGDGGILLAAPADSSTLCASASQAALRARQPSSFGTGRFTFLGRWHTPQRALVVDGVVNLACASGIWFEVDIKPGKRGHAPKVRGVTPDVPLGVSVDLKGQMLPFPEVLDAELLRSILPFEPSIVNCSGHGAHVALLFDEPLTFGRDDFDALAAFLRLQADLRLYVQLRLAELGYASDPMNPLAIMRFAGTWNQKPSTPPSAVFRLHESARRYTLDEIEEHISAALPLRGVLDVSKQLRSRRRRERGAGSSTGVFGELEPEKIQKLDFVRDANGAPAQIKNGTGNAYRSFDLPKGEGRPGSARDEFQQRISLEATLALLGFQAAGNLGYARPGGKLKRDAFAFPRGGGGAEGFALHIVADGVRVGDGALELPQGSTIGAFELAAIALYGPRDVAALKKACGDFHRALRRRGFGTARDVAEERVAQAKAAEPIPRARPSFHHDAVSLNDARRVVQDRLSAHQPGLGQSLALIAPPGVGKTQTAINVLLRKLHDRAPGFESGVAMIALPTRAIVLEKAKNAREIAELIGVVTMVRVVLGKQEDGESGFLCADYAAAERRRKAGHHPCMNCTKWEACSTLRGRFVRDFDNLELGAARSPDHSPVLYIGTHAIAGAFLEAMPEALVIRDDHPPSPIGSMSLVDEVVLDLQSLIEARPRIAEWLAANGGEGGAAAAAGLWIKAWTKLESQLRSLEGSLDDVAGKAAWRIVERLVKTCGIPKSVAKEEFDAWEKRGADPSDLVARLLSLGEEKLETPDLVVARVVHQLVSGIGDLSERLASVAATLPAPLARRLRAGEVESPKARDGTPEPWPWERPSQGEALDAVPAITDRVLRLLRAEVSGTPPLIETVPRPRGGGLIAYVANDPVIQAIKRGNLILLGVEDPVAGVLEALPLRFERVSYWPPSLRTLGIQANVRDLIGAEDAVIMVERLGAGLRVRCSPKRERGKRERKQDVDAGEGGVSTSDARFRRLVMDLVRRHVDGAALDGERRPGPLGIVLHLEDLRALEADPENAELLRYARAELLVRFATFGASHMSTDELRDCGLLIVRRWTLHPSEFARWARAFRSVFPGPPIRDGATHRLCRWEGLPESSPNILVQGALDPLVGSFCEAFDTYALLNAMGRSRGHSTSEARVVLVASGSPVRGLRLSELIDEKGLQARFAASIELSVRELRRGRVHGRARALASAKARAARMREIIAKEGMLSRVELASRVGATPRQIKRWLEEYQISSRAGEPGYECFVGRAKPEAAEAWAQQVLTVVASGRIGLHRNKDSITVQANLAAKVTAAHVGTELARSGGPAYSERSIRDALAAIRSVLAGEPSLPPRKGSARTRILRVAEALGRVVEAAASPAAPEDCDVAQAMPKRPRKWRKKNDAAATGALAGLGVPEKEVFPWWEEH